MTTPSKLASWGSLIPSAEHAEPDVLTESSIFSINRCTMHLSPVVGFTGGVKLVLSRKLLLVLTRAGAGDDGDRFLSGRVGKSLASACVLRFHCLVRQDDASVSVGDEQNLQSSSSYAKSITIYDSSIARLSMSTRKTEKKIDASFGFLDSGTKSRSSHISWFSFNHISVKCCRCIKRLNDTNYNLRNNLYI